MNDESGLLGVSNHSSDFIQKIKMVVEKEK